MLTDGPIPKKLLIIAAVIILITAAAAAFFIYDDIKRQEAHRNSVKALYQENLNSADYAYAAVQGYPEPAHKKLPEEYNTWLTGYEEVLGNFTSVVNNTLATGAEYQQAFGSGSPEYSWVQQNNTRLNQTLADLTRGYEGYKADYLSLSEAKEQARLAYETAYANSTSAYEMANASLSKEAEAAYKGLKAYMDAGSANLTRYKDTVNSTLSAGETYQEYLRGDSAEYESILARGTTLKKNANNLDSRYASLQDRVPVLNVTIGNTDYNYGADVGWYEYVTFLVNNTDYPTPVWNVTVHFKLIENQTGMVKSTDDVPVTVYAQLSKYYGAILPIERDHNYYVVTSVTYDY
ncbi:hypothetical protein [Methanocella sp. MCL-LM]|uniref:hypothetical protein n=1 Tax=Methanocella sp. MCL-LM TaxID=3412035 RepID=UPI003C778777